MLRWGRPSRRRAAPGLSVLAAGVMATALTLLAQGVGLLNAYEQRSIALRFELREPQPTREVTVVAIDERTFEELELPWPFPRRRHAQAIDRLREAGVERIVYDVQFTEPTRPAQDMALYRALGRTPGVVLATTETDGRGATNVLGGDENLRAVGARAGAANLVSEEGGVIHRFRHSENGLQTLGALTAALTPGAGVAREEFPDGGAWIDFRGPPRTIDTVSFSQVLRGEVDPEALRGRIVVVGLTTPTHQDVHATPTSDDRLMSGAEIQANAIWTALNGLPLRSAPPWVGWLAIALAGFAPALAVVRGRAERAVLLAPLLGAAWLLGSQVAFEHGTILPIAAPLLALLLGTVSASTFAFVLERERRRRASLAGERLEREVRARTEELRETQLEVVSRLGRAVESRDADTGEHVDRMALLCERLALGLGMDAAEAELLRHAAVLHDVGKVGVPDAILRKPGRYEPEERAVMEGHTLIGAQILEHSRSPLVALAATIARSHHERWDGKGYPDGLAGEEIPLPARIASICDVFDALLSARPYKAAWSLAEARAELAAQRGRQFDPDLVDVFLTLVDELEPELVAPAGAGEPEIEEPEPLPRFVAGVRGR